MSKWQTTCNTGQNDDSALWNRKLCCISNSDEYKINKWVTISDGF